MTHEQIEQIAYSLWVKDTSGSADDNWREAEELLKESYFSTNRDECDKELLLEISKDDRIKKDPNIKQNPWFTIRIKGDGTGAVLCAEHMECHTNIKKGMLTIWRHRPSLDFVELASVLGWHNYDITKQHKKKHLYYFDLIGKPKTMFKDIIDKCIEHLVPDDEP